MKKLRLLLTEYCKRNCENCCNKQYHLYSLPVVSSYIEYDEICITGGEPLLFPILLSNTIEKIRKESNAKIYLYTAELLPIPFINALNIVDGITLTLHEQSDVKDFEYLDSYLADCVFRKKSMRLNIFDNINISYINIHRWNPKFIHWQKICPIPKDEVFMRL